MHMSVNFFDMEDSYFILANYVYYNNWYPVFILQTLIVAEGAICRQFVNEYKTREKYVNGSDDFLDFERLMVIHFFWPTLARFCKEAKKYDKNLEVESKKCRANLLSTEINN